MLLLLIASMHGINNMRSVRACQRSAGVAVRGAAHADVAKIEPRAPSVVGINRSAHVPF